MNCDEAREEIVSLLYGELAKDRAEAVDRHVQSCAGCREEWAAHLRTVRLLDRWTEPKVSVPTSRIAGTSGAIGRRASVRSSPRPILIGAAAGLLLFAALALLGASAEFEGGRLTLSLSLPGSSLSPRTAPVGAELAPLVRGIAREEIEWQLGTILAALGSEFQDFGRTMERRHLDLARTLETRREAEARLFDAALRGIAESVVEDRHRTREALGSVLRWTTSSPSSPSGDGR